MGVIARLEFELPYYDVTVQYVKHYAMETFTFRVWVYFSLTQEFNDHYDDETKFRQVSFGLVDLVGLLVT